jgi:hypothetical protein
MNKILISSPRCGSTVAQKEFDKQVGIKSSDVFGWHEFFLDAPHGINMSIESKVNFIENLKKPFIYKLHAFHLWYPYKDGILFDWFCDFYKDWKWVILKRKDLWRAYISLLVHHQKGRSYWHKYKEDDENHLEEICAKKIFTFNMDVRNAFIHQQQCLNKIQGEVIYLEDNAWDGLKWNIDYERCFEKQELENIRRDFQKFSRFLYQ